MKNEIVKAIAAHDQERQKHLEAFRRSFKKDPDRFRKHMALAVEYLQRMAEWGDGVKLGQAMFGARMGMFGFHLLFEEMSRWEEENAEGE